MYLPRTQCVELSEFSITLILREIKFGDVSRQRCNMAVLELPDSPMLISRKILMKEKF